MHLMINATDIGRQRGGNESFLLGLLDGLRSLPGGAGQDHFSLVACRAGLPTLSAWDWPLRFDLIDAGPWRRWPFYLWQQTRLLRRARPDWYLSTFLLPLAVPCQAAVLVHDLSFRAHPEFFPQFEDAKRLVMHLMMAFTCRRAQLISCDSEWTAHDLHTLLGVPKNKLRVVSLGVDERFFQPALPDALQELRQRMHLDQPFILFVGERRPHKNLIGLMKAFSLFRRLSNQPYQLVIAGKRYADYQEPETIAKQFGLSDSICFLDYVAEFDLPVLYQAAEAFISLSHYEGFGLPILEAMASGTPVVAANCTALPKVVGEAGMLVDPDNPDQAADALHQIVRGGAQREQMIALGSERARQYTWERTAQKTLEIYREAQTR